MLIINNKKYKILKKQIQDPYILELEEFIYIDLLKINVDNKRGEFISLLGSITRDPFSHTNLIITNSNNEDTL